MMINYKLHKRIAFAALALIAAGCSGLPTKPTVGIVTPNDSVAVGVGSQAPDVTFLDRSGARRSLSAIYEDATVVAFTNGPCT